MTTFINIHAIQSLPPSSLNRDDSGVPKKALFGGTERVRVSSQSWKFAIRKFFSDNYDSSYIGCRTTQLPVEFEKALRSIRPEADDALVKKLTKTVLGVAEKTEEDGAGFEPGSVAGSKMIVFYSPAQLEALVTIAIEVVDGKRKGVTVSEIKEALVGKNTVDIALFGRMMTAQAELSVDAAANVAHVIGVDKYESQRDSFVGLDDNLGKAKILGSIDFVSSVVYRYACIDADSLTKNLDGDKTFSAEAAGAFINAFIRSMPSGKQSSFAAHTLPSFVLVTLSDNQPLSLASAFTRVISGDDIENDAIDALVENAMMISDNYGEPIAAFTLHDGTHDIPFAKKVSLPDLVDSVKKAY
jgi:CRISPR system Cascade subunit CasC